MDPKWFPPPDRPPQPENIMLFYATGIVVVTLLHPPSRIRNWIALPWLICTAYSQRRHTTGREETDYMGSISLLFVTFRWFDFAVLRTAEEYAGRVRDDGSVETAAEVKNLTLLGKLRWVLGLVFTQRGVGWNWQVKNVEEVPKDMSKRNWIVRHTIYRQGERVPNFFYLPIWQQVLTAWSLMFGSGWGISQIYSLAAAIAVTTNLSKPQDWPASFGSYSEAYTMRNVWGKCWHQYLRRIFETTNSTIMSLLQIPKGTIMSRYLQLYVAFITSAIIHHVGALNITYMPTVHYQFLFFVSQAVAITIEDFAIYLGKRVGIKSSWKTKTLGYLYVFSALSFTSRTFAKYIIDVELDGVEHPVFGSVMDRVFGR